MASPTSERFKTMRGKPPDEAGFFWSGGPIEVAERTWFQSRFSGVTAFETDQGIVLVDSGMAPLGPPKDDLAIGVVMLKDYTMLMTRIAVITKAARHPAAARLFLDYLLSADGQSQMARRSFGTVRSDLADEARITAGDVTLRPIHVGPELLTYLDQAKRKTFFREWRRALDER